jgi:predicted nucleic acid-binding protein
LICSSNALKRNSCIARHGRNFRGLRSEGSKPAAVTCDARRLFGSANDCLTATHAILGGMPLLHRDRDFGLIAGIEPKLILFAAGK